MPSGSVVLSAQAPPSLGRGEPRNEAIHLLRSCINKDSLNPWSICKPLLNLAILGKWVSIPKLTTDSSLDLGHVHVHNFSMDSWFLYSKHQPPILTTAVYKVFTFLTWRNGWDTTVKRSELDRYIYTCVCRYRCCASGFCFQFYIQSCYVLSVLLLKTTCRVIRFQNSFFSLLRHQGFIQGREGNMGFSSTHTHAHSKFPK